MAHAPTPPASTAKRPGWIAPALAGLLAAALSFDQLRIGWRAAHAPVSHLFSAPPLALWFPLCGLVLGSVGAAAFGVRRRDVRLTRLPAMTLAVVLFVEVFLVPQVRPIDATGDAVGAQHIAAAETQALAMHLGHLPRTAEELRPALAKLPPPPYLLRGQALPTWSLWVRTDCAGPVAKAPDVAAGTLIYCLAPGGAKAWITVVGRSSSRFGPAEVISAEGKALFTTVELPRG